MVIFYSFHDYVNNNNNNNNITIIRLSRQRKEKCNKYNINILFEYIFYS